MQFQQFFFKPLNGNINIANLLEKSMDLQSMYFSIINVAYFNFHELKSEFAEAFELYSWFYEHHLEMRMLIIYVESFLYWDFSKMNWPINF